jgi:hypothetical protein
VQGRGLGGNERAPIRQRGQLFGEGPADGFLVVHDQDGVGHDDLMIQPDGAK